MRLWHSTTEMHRRDARRSYWNWTRKVVSSSQTTLQ